MLGSFGGFWDTWYSGHKVTFDGINKLIIINSGVTNLNVKTDIYSDWKEWMVFNETLNTKFLPAMRSVGGDPISDTEKLGDSYFLINGWKIKPWEGHTSITIDGNIYSDDGLRPVVPDDNGVDAVSLKFSVLTNTVIVDTGGDEIDVIAPTWDSLEGITNVYQNGSNINIAWAKASDNSNSVRYNVYISKVEPTLATPLFDETNLHNVSDGYFMSISGLDNEPFDGGTTYYIGVKAVDPSGNETENENYASLTYSSLSGNISAGDIQAIAESVWDVNKDTITNVNSIGYYLKQKILSVTKYLSFK